MEFSRKIKGIKHIIIPAILCCILAGCGGSPQAPDMSGYLPVEGDIAFRRGPGMRSRAVIIADSLGTFSHAGIVVRSGDSFKIAHIAPGEREEGDSLDRIKLEGFEEFFAPDRATGGEIRRLAGADTTAARAGRYALDIYRRGITFDHDYDLSDTVRMYCTELIWHAYGAAGRDITNRRRTMVGSGLWRGDYIMPADIYANDSLITVFKYRK